MYKKYSNHKLYMTGNTAFVVTCVNFATLFIHIEDPYFSSYFIGRSLVLAVTFFIGFGCYSTLIHRGIPIEELSINKKRDL